MWTQALRRPARRGDDPDEVWDTIPAPWPSSKGHRIVWVRSSSKIVRDADRRHDRIARGIAALDALNQRLVSPRSRTKTAVAAEAAAQAALAKAGASRWITFQVVATEVESFRQEKRGRPSTNTRYRKTTRQQFSIRWAT